jgi:SAM-dependent methyltransferase
MGGGHGGVPETSLEAHEVGRSPLAAGHYDCAVVIFQLEKATNPIALLERIHAALKPDGALLLVTPSLDSWPARVFRSQWPGWHRRSLYYFDTQTVQSALLRSGFAQIHISRDHQRYSLQHLYERAQTIPRGWIARAIRALHHVVPRPLRRAVRLRLPTSAIVVTARRMSRRKRPLLSVIMPVYNERPTFEQTMNAVIAKEVPGIDKEIIVVESNSTDGTRDVALRYRDHPGVKLVLEDRPRGKGSAVRAGLEQATGDFILIQDGDQEYDVNDYDALLEPLRTYQRAFVLGSRHVAADWKLRKFTDQPAIAMFFNVGHLLFATALNLMYGQRIKDPFTMYKVFRRDCVHGLKLECHRFDFDFELVIKLVRKGYAPLEIPINYQSRSLTEGKKVSIVKDPVTWLWALIRFRFSRLYV